MIFFKNSSGISKRIRAIVHPDPVRDWFVLLVLSLIMLGVIVVWNIWAFDTVANGGVITTSAATTTPAFSQSSIDTIHSIFQARDGEEAKYVSGEYHFTDPSL